MADADVPTFPLDRPWPFRIALGVWLIAGVVAWWFADGFGVPAQVLLAGLWLAGLALILRQFLVSLFGPVLAYDILRVGRRSRQIWFRVAYAGLLAFLLTWVYLSWLSFSTYGGSGRVDPKQMAKLAETYFYVYMVVQFIAVCVLTPAAVAGAIADEKERRTLEFLLATDLLDREILFGKLASRVGSLLLLLAAGLPILTLMQFFGGIDPDLVIAGFAATVVLVLSLSALGMAASVLARKARDAIALTYLFAIMYVALSFVLWALFSIPALSWSIELLGYTLASSDLAYPVVAGNPFYMVPAVAINRGVGMGVPLYRGLGHFALFHALFIVLFLAWAGTRLRSIALGQTFGSGPKLSRRQRRAMKDPPPRTSAARAIPRKPSRWRRPQVGEWPILWKEVFVDAGLRFGTFGKALLIFVVTLSYVPVVFIVWFALFEDNTWQPRGPWWSSQRWDDLGQGMNAYLRAGGAIASSLVLLAIAVRGSGVVSGERDKHTLDVLLTTPLSARSIIWGKWWGCILGMRWAWAWVFSLWVLALATGGVHFIMLPAGLISAAVYASGYAWIGVFCSLHMRTTLRATMFAIVIGLFAGGGYFLVFVCCCAIPMSFGGGSGSDRGLEVIVNGLSGFAPPVNMAFLPIREFETWEVSFISGRDMPYPIFWVMGLLGWTVFSGLMSKVCVEKFRRMANRIAHPGGRPGPPPLPARNLPDAPEA